MAERAPNNDKGMKRRKGHMARRIEEPPTMCSTPTTISNSVATVPPFRLACKRQGETEGGASGGFRRVAGYIFGGNSERASIAMTAPVSMWDEDGSGWLAFTMPSAYATRCLASAKRRGVLTSKPVATVAVARFTGRSTPKKTVRVEATLRAAVEREGTRGGTGSAGRLGPAVHGAVRQSVKRDNG